MLSVFLLFVFTLRASTIQGNTGGDVSKGVETRNRHTYNEEKGANKNKSAYIWLLRQIVFKPFLELDDRLPFVYLK